MNLVARCLLLLGIASAGAVAAPAARPPNFIVILADDLGCGDLSLYDGWVRTPRIERMAREGMRFTDFHANSSVCSPTRVAFHTGRYQQRAGIVDVIVGRDPAEKGLAPETPTLAKVLRQAGYATGLFGKWHCGHQDESNPTRLGFDEFVGFLHGGADYHRHQNWRNGLRVEDVAGYSTDLITERSVDFIRRHRDRPFFLHVGHQAVHNPYQTRADRPETRAADWKQNSVGEVNRDRYRTLIEDLDQSVGRLLDAVGDLGLAKDTLVFFWSDNGDVGMSPAPRPYRGTKFSHYEGGHRVPAVVWWPGRIPAGSRSDALIAGFDLFPTLVEIAGAGAQAPPNLDGISVRRHWLNQEELPARDLFFGYEPKLGTAMRRGDWKMILKDGEAQLYHLRDDRKETRNLAAERPEITAALRGAIEEFKRTVTPGS
ncbi:MAG: sulfatase-like hydrolase/transferase [Opitutaceae bacterium]